MTIRLNKLQANLYVFNTQADNPTSDTFAETEYLVSRYGFQATWLVSSSLDPLVLISEHPTLTAVKEHYGSLVDSSL